MTARTSFMHTARISLNDRCPLCPKGHLLTLFSYVYVHDLNLEMPSSDADSGVDNSPENGRHLEEALHYAWKRYNAASISGLSIIHACMHVCVSTRVYGNVSKST